MTKPTPVMDRMTRRSIEAPCLVKGLHPVCWVWQGAKRNRDGYGAVGVAAGRSDNVHLIAYKEFIGGVPPGLVVTHLCRVPACWNPWHLEPVTRVVAARRGNGPKVAAQRRDTKTHCAQGHEFDEENSGRTPSGRRFCRVCQRRSSRSWYQKYVAKTAHPPRTSESRQAEAAKCRRLRSEGRTTKEIADLLGLAQSTVYERLRVAA
jgi:hypothetical protein